MSVEKLDWRLLRAVVSVIQQPLDRSRFGLRFRRISNSWLVRTIDGHDVVAIHFNWRNDWPDVRDFLPLLEEQLTPFEPRPHWGKLSEIDPAQVGARYPRIDDFRSLADEFDPSGKFRYAYINRCIFG